MQKNKIFISHSAKDKAYIDSFVEKILILGLEIPSTRIFCSSMEGQGIRSGQHITTKLREEINQSELALLFISKNYKSSEICLNEVGATWATLASESVIPLLLPDVDFGEIGVLNLGKIGVRIKERSEILKLIQDCREQLNPDLKIQKLSAQVDRFITSVQSFIEENNIHTTTTKNQQINEWDQCFTYTLFPFHEIINKSTPTLPDGIHNITDAKTQDQIFMELSKGTFLENLWYKHSEGDFYVEKLRKLPSGNWLLSQANWEVKISDMWVSKNIELQYEFILFRSEKQEPYNINSDIGGSSYNVAILNDGTIISNIEYQNSYAVINGQTINTTDYDSKPRFREDESHWTFFVSDYHKAGYNPDETIEFCKKIDKGEININQQTIMQFLSKLKNNPIVTRWR
ncbi:TIR domain-containing protein [Arachidicoccus rhizosphaerae]|uniref:TIR domain-containing protein n=1 Tax=Arachidicoccus rhizosphaerae TaxID=551991 RepID=A0A1H3YTI2_9BACT|nr:toll/interleukin-1 receptor domain-containing protein [Arachidicoccus rhizosphaerae]SEA14869.1 TIR domain-containing protein [Arachidicoccus rhizosphaerae]